MSNAAPAHAPERARAEFGMVLVVLIWGMNFAITKATLDHIPPLALTAVRFGLAAVAMLLAVRWIEGPLRLERAALIRLAVVGIVGNSLYQPLFILGLHKTTAANSSVIIGSLPGVVALLAWGLRIEKVTWQVATGIAISLCGLVTVVGATRVSLGGSTTVGDLLTVVAVFCWAAYTLGIRKMDASLSPLRITAVTTAVGTLPLLLLGLPEILTTEWMAAPLWAYAGLVYASMLSLVAAYLLYTAGVKRIGASRAAAFSSFIPVVGVATAWAFAGEQPGWPQIAGGLLVFAGVWLTRRR